MSKVVVTIDGPAGTGKSTVAKKLASRLGFQFLNTGGMYRGVAWHCLEQGIDLQDELAVADLASQLEFSIDNHHMVVNGVDIHSVGRAEQIGQAASILAAYSSVREILNEWQRKLASHHSIVTEGRDQGTVVFPDADCKIYLTARPEVRAQRRYNDLKEKIDVTYDQIFSEQQQRDERDQNRELAPLRPADDAQIVDSSDLELEDVVGRLVNLVHQATT